MSQVKKLQNGGSFTIDGIKYDATPDFINNLSNHLKNTAGVDAQTLAGLTNALQNGQNLTYDSATNTISGMSGLWGGITDKQNEHRKANTSKWRKFWDAQFETDAHRFRNALSAIGSFHYQAPNTTADETSNLKDIYGDTAWFEYIKDDNGNDIWSQNSGINSGLFQRLDDMTSYLRDPEAGKKIYKLASQYNPQHMQGLQALYDQNKDRWDATLEDIKGRARNNNLSDEDIKFLNNFFIVKPDATTEVGTRLSAGDKQKWQNAGYGNLIALLGEKAHLNDDGSISLNDGESWGWNLGDLEGRNIWFNDDFYNSRYGADGSFDPYRNYTLYNNRLYALDNPVLARILNAESGFNAMMKAGNWAGADDIILTRFTDAARENPVYLSPDQYSTFLSVNPNYRFSDLTGLATTNGMTDDQQLIQYTNLGDDTFEGPYRRYNYKYALLNNRAGLERELNPEDIVQIENGKARETGLNTYKRTVGDNNGAYDNRYYEDILDKDGQATGFRFYRSIKNPNEDVILHMPDINASGVTENQDIAIPKEIAQVLSTNTNWLNNVVGNAQNKKNFINIISSLIKSRIAQRDNTGLPFDIRLNERNQLRKMGFSEVEVEQLKQALQNYRKGSRSQRRVDRLVNAPQLEKNGGVLKDQKGGIAGGAKTATGVTERRINTTNTNPKNAAGAAEIGSNNWTNADTADMVALVSDLGSLTTAFIPGANLASVATGATGSTARLYADLSRGTKGAIPNYLLNLGMDATMLLPVLGGMGKVARIPKAIKSALPTIVKAASVYGLGAGVVETAKKIASGEKFTARDVDMLVNAITAGVGLGKSGGIGKQRKEMAIKDIKIKNNITNVNGASKAIEGTTSFNIKGSDLNNVNTPEAFKKLVVSKAKAAGDTNVTIENVGERYDLSDFIDSTGKKWKPGLNPKNWFRTEGKEVVTKFKPEPTDKLKESKTNIGKWHRREGQYQQDYNAQLQGTPRQEIVLPQGSGKQLMYLDTNLPAVVKTLPRKGIALPQWINSFTKANYQENVDVQPSGAVMQPLYKKGGRILRGQTGLKTREFETIPTSTPSITTKATTQSQPYFNKQLQNSYDNQYKDTTLQGTYNAKKYNPDLNVPLNWARSLYAMKQSDKQLDNFLNRPKYHMDAPLLNAPRFISSGEGDAYRAIANKIRMSKPITSDAISNDVMQRQRQQDAFNYEMQGALADSKEFGEYLNNLNNFTNQEILRRTDIHNQNRHFDWQHDIEDVEMKNANIAEKSKFFDQAAYATQDWYNRNWQTKTAIDAANAYQTELNNLSEWYNQQMTDHYAKFKDSLDSDSAAQHLALIKSQLELRKNNLGYIGLSSQLSPMFKQRWGYKKGGKVSDGKRSAVTYSRDPYPELLLQNAKDSTKIVEKLNDSVIKLILQTKPTHVS